MAVHHSDAPQELERVARRIKTLETASPSNHTPDSEHPGPGAGSTQVGVSPTASGEQSLALGYGTFAFGKWSIAVGRADAYGEGSLAIGDAAIANADYAAAIGPGAATNKEWEMALGEGRTRVFVGGTLNVFQADRHTPSRAPTSSGDTAGETGDICYDNNYIYVKTIGGGWKRAALSTF